MIAAPAAQILFERHARRNGVPFSREERGRHLCYRIRFEVPVHDESREALIEFKAGAVPDYPRVTIDGPECLRHRYSDTSLCMWWPADGPGRRWTVQDGLLDLIVQIKLHAYCEAECRAGKAWPKAEAPGRHRRPPMCTSCRGRGA